MNARSNAQSISIPHPVSAMHGRTDGRTDAEASSPSSQISPSVTRALAYGDPSPETIERKREAQRRRRRLMAYGRWEPTVSVPVGRAVEHVESLRRYGISLDAISDLTGITAGNLGRFLYLDAGSHRRRIRPQTQERILAARFDLDAIAEHRKVSGAGTRRRIHALARLGWSTIYIGQRMGVSRQAVMGWTKLENVTVGTAKRIRDLYDELAMSPGPSASAARQAARRGWLPPLAWDDETLDDPTAQPYTETARGCPGGRPSQDTVEDVEWLLSVDGTLTPEQLGARFGVSKDAIYLAVRRVGEAAEEEVRASLGHPLVCTREQSRAIADALARTDRLHATLTANSTAQVPERRAS